MAGVSSPVKSSEISGTLTSGYSGAEAGLSDAEVESAKCNSPLNELMPNISTEKINPLVVSFCNRVTTLDVTQRDSRIILGQMFLEIIEAVSKLILDAFKDIVLEGKDGLGPLLVSEEAVRRAVQPSLCQSFKAVLGSTHKSMKKLFRLVCDEVTNWVNNCLCYSKVKGNRLVLPEDSNYKPPCDKLKSIGHQVKRMLCAFMPHGVGSTSSPKTLTPTKVRPETPIHHLSPAITKPDSPTINMRAAVDAVKEILEAEAACLSEEEMSYNSEDTASTIVTIILDEMEHMHSGMSRESQTWSKQMDFSVSKTPRLRGVAHKIKSFFVLCYTRATFCSLLRKMCCEDTVSSSERVIPLLEDLASGGTTKFDGDIYERLSENISSGHCDTLTEQLTDIISENLPPQNRRRKSRTEVRAVLDVFMEDIRKWLQNQQQIPAKKDPVQRALKKIHSLASEMSSLTQVKYPMTASSEDPNMVYSPCLVAPDDDEVASAHMSKNESKIIKWTSPSTVEQTDQWNLETYSDLIYEVSKRIFGKKEMSKMEELGQKVLQQLEQQVPEWDILVQPDIPHIMDLAEAVYSDLCRSRMKNWVRNSAEMQKDFITIVVNTIRKHLEFPEQRKRTFGSFLRSVCAFFRRR